MHVSGGKARLRAAKDELRRGITFTNDRVVPGMRAGTAVILRRAASGLQRTARMLEQGQGPGWLRRG